MQHRIARPVLIIGTSTLGQRYFDDPEYAGLSIYELFAYACHQAMEDANLKPKDIDKLAYSHFAYFPTCGNIMAPVGIMEEWIGMREKPIRRLTAVWCAAWAAAYDRRHRAGIQILRKGRRESCINCVRF